MLKFIQLHFHLFQLTESEIQVMYIAYCSLSLYVYTAHLANAVGQIGYLYTVVIL